MRTKYATLSVAELLRLLIEERAKSEIIEELCQRLEGGD